MGTPVRSRRHGCNASRIAASVYEGDQMRVGQTMKMAGILMLGMMLLAACSPTGLQEPDLAGRVQHLEDIEEIRNVLLDYGRFLDSRDFEAYSQLFAEDGEWIGGFGTVKGPEAIQEFMVDAIPGPNSGNTYHLLSNFVIEVDGDNATAWSRWAFVTGGTDDRPTPAQGGHYDDILIREDGRWKFMRREAVLDIPVSGLP
jgi:uncharacterized protein (TIGR02246 family)